MDSLNWQDLVHGEHFCFDAYEINKSIFFLYL